MKYVWLDYYRIAVDGAETLLLRQAVPTEDSPEEGPELELPIYKERFVYLGASGPPVTLEEGEKVVLRISRLLVAEPDEVDAEELEQFRSEQPSLQRDTELVLAALAEAPERKQAEAALNRILARLPEGLEQETPRQFYERTTGAYVPSEHRYPEGDE
jgi:hypothetical protein